MITVRFPNGQSVQYNGASHMTHDGYGTRIWAKKGGHQIARIQHSAGAILEFEAPCRVYDALADNQLADLTKEVRSLKRKVAQWVGKR